MKNGHTKARPPSVVAVCKPAVAFLRWSCNSRYSQQEVLLVEWPPLSKAYDEIALALSSGGRVHDDFPAKHILCAACFSRFVAHRESRPSAFAMQ
jgi:hypothetical protein